MDAERATAKRWQVASILRSNNLEALFDGTPWEREAKRLSLEHAAAVRVQDREWLDGPLPLEMLAHGCSAAGLVAYRTDDGYLRVSEPGTPIAMADVVSMYGSSFVEDMLEFGSMRAPSAV